MSGQGKQAKILSEAQVRAALAASCCFLLRPPILRLMELLKKQIDADLLQHMARLGKSREETLKHFVVDYTAALYMERAAKQMFGSQIDALNYLIANNGRGTKENLRPIYIYPVAAHRPPESLFSRVLNV
jgi:hypothetical protein